MPRLDCTVQDWAWSWCLHCITGVKRTLSQNNQQDLRDFKTLVDYILAIIGEALAARTQAFFTMSSSALILESFSYPFQPTSMKKNLMLSPQNR